MKVQVCIIIPTYNRASFLEETITSIQNQTFTDWECIIVDDGSTDDSLALLKKIEKEDPRIKVMQRPTHLKKGGNTCRNIGLDHAQGMYIQFFDSDDLMKEDMLQQKVAMLQSQTCDYVISKTESFQHPDPLEIINKQDHYYTFDTYPINHKNYVTQKVNWLTPDFMGIATLFETLRFNDKLPSGQEYNLFSKLTLKSEKGVVLDAFTTLRRMHDTSIRAVLTKDKGRLQNDRALLYKETYLELKHKKAPREGLRFLLKNLCLLYLNDTPSFKHVFFICRALSHTHTLKVSLSYVLYQLSAVFFNKGYQFKNNVLKSL
jgi:glycosyltransferase involved in cell wall biosynthesis